MSLDRSLVGAVIGREESAAVCLFECVGSFAAMDRSYRHCAGVSYTCSGTLNTWRR